jgi:ABC-type nitrate/sulfonate/bicarbonate transport system substrate-binding protein
MIEGNVQAILNVIDAEEKKAKERIALHYQEKEKMYLALIEKKVKEKKAIMKEYFDSILKNSEAYLKREHDYTELYEDYKVLVSSFNKAWERAEKRISEHPEGYVRFALLKFQEMLGKPDNAIASAEFRPYIQRIVPTELSKKKLVLKIYQGTTYADFSPSFIKEFILPMYADKAMGEK